MANKQKEFLLGVNYWPRKKAINWWKDFDKKEIEKEFKEIKNLNLRIVRIFLIWEDFQPSAREINRDSLKNLKSVLDIAAKNNLRLIITFFTGHMSGINFVPLWALSKKKAKFSRAYSISAGKISKYKIKNLFTDPFMLKAQKFHLKKIILEIHKHKAIFAYDLSNEVGNLLMPDSKALRSWQSELIKEIRKTDKKTFITCGSLHFYYSKISDFLENDLISIHSYLSPKKIEELCLAAKKLGKPVLLEEFGAPNSKKSRYIWTRTGDRKFKIKIKTEQEAAKYYKEILEKTCSLGCVGALAWCFSDFDKRVWKKPPYDRTIHEKLFGITRRDSSIKPAGKLLGEFVKKQDN